MADSTCHPTTFMFPIEKLSLTTSQDKPSTRHLGPVELPLLFEESSTKVLHLLFVWLLPSLSPSPSLSRLFPFKR